MFLIVRFLETVVTVTRTTHVPFESVRTLVPEILHFFWYFEEIAKEIFAFLGTEIFAVRARVALEIFRFTFVVNLGVNFVWRRIVLMIGAEWVKPSTETLNQPFCSPTLVVEAPVVPEACTTETSALIGSDVNP